eukprot:NODE_63_length_25098_cov_0.440498.p7 type:complete len:415 gc:universal NODE_63_length_25098_cov_0.440498:9075-10319(+)
MSSPKRLQTPNLNYSYIQTQENVDLDDLELMNNLESNSDESLTEQKLNTIKSKSKRVVSSSPSYAKVPSSPFHSRNTKSVQKPKADATMELGQSAELSSEAILDSQIESDKMEYVGFSRYISYFVDVFKDQYRGCFLSWYNFLKLNPDSLLQVLSKLPYLAGSSSPRLNNKWAHIWHLVRCKLPFEFQELAQEYPCLIERICEVVADKTDFKTFKSHINSVKREIEKLFVVSVKKLSHIEGSAIDLRIFTYMCLDSSIFNLLVDKYVDFKESEHLPVQELHSNYSQQHGYPSRKESSPVFASAPKSSATPNSRNTSKSPTLNNFDESIDIEDRKLVVPQASSTPRNNVNYSATVSRTVDEFNSKTISQTVNSLEVQFPSLSVDEIMDLFYICNYNEQRFLKYMDEKQSSNLLLI